MDNKEIELLKKACGAIPQEPEIKHARYELIFGIGDAKPINWLEFFSPRERQWWIPFCVTYSRLAIAEAIARSCGLIIEFSKRWLGVISGTTKKGNYLTTVSDAFRKKGCVLQKFCTFTKKMISEGWLPGNWERIFDLSDVDPNVRKYLGGNHSWVPRNPRAISDALAYSPIQLSCPVGDTWEDEIVTPPSVIHGYHAIACYWIDDKYYYIQDSCGRELKKLTHNYPLTGAMSFRDLPENWREVQNMKNRINHNDEQYIVNGNKIHHIPDPDTLNLFIEIGWISKSEPQKVNDLSVYEVGKPLPSVLVTEKVKELQPFFDDALKVKEENKNFSAGFTVGKIWASIVNFFKGRL